MITIKRKLSDGRVVSYTGERGEVMRPDGWHDEKGDVIPIGSLCVPLTQEQKNAAHAMVVYSNLLMQNLKEIKKMNRKAKLTAERDELVNKVKRLKKFMKSDKYKNLDGIDQELLSIQKTQMKALIKTLDARINWEF